MDADNHADLVALARPDADRVRMFRDFDPRADGRDRRRARSRTTAATTASSEVLAMVERTADALVAALERSLAAVARWRRTTDMARLGGIAHRAETLLGTAVVATTPVAGGDICTATRLRLSNGTLRADQDPAARAGGLLPHRGRRAALARRGRRGRRAPRCSPSRTTA